MVVYGETGSSLSRHNANGSYIRIAAVRQIHHGYSPIWHPQKVELGPIAIAHQANVLTPTAGLNRPAHETAD